jgi:hypothetical protein
MPVISLVSAVCEFAIDVASARTTSVSPWAWA